jgi:hypothetical protein
MTTKKTIPMFFAFSNSQFDEGIKAWGITDYQKEIYCVGCGGYIRTEDYQRFKALLTKQKEDLKTALKAPEFFYDAFFYELGNHEYCYTRDETETWESLGLYPDKPEFWEFFALEGINASYEKAKKDYLRLMEEMEEMEL